MLFYYHYNLIHFYRLKKALPLHGNIPAMSMNYTMQTNNKTLHVIARWVYDLPGDFCRILAAVPGRKNSLRNFQKGGL